VNFTKMTNEYYSKWLGVSPEIINTNGVIFIESSERDKCQAGYSYTFDVYTYITNNLIIVSYTKRLSDKIEKMKQEVHLGMTTEEVTNIMESVFNTNVKKHMKFCYNKPLSNIDTINTVKLFEADYPKYLEFFRTQNPNAKADGWLHKYFNCISRSGLAFGIFENNKLVSATDKPDMPYMANKVQEVGINTLPEYRGKGYSKSAILACIKAIIEEGKCPQWSCATNNTISEKLAYEVGYKKLADVLTIDLLL